MNHTATSDLTQSVLDAAIEYIDHGWACIDIPHRQKAPIRDGWQKSRMNNLLAQTLFNGTPKNIGVLLGEPSGWLVDIDLDHEHAIVEAENFLPATGAVFGRAGKPRSHWLYRTSAPIRTHKRQTPDKQMLVELRASGCQTVFPPSVHPSGERIEWHANGEPLLIEPGELRLCVDRLADAVLSHLGIDAATTAASTTATTAANTISKPGPLDVAERARRYLAQMPGAVSGQGGHNQTYRAACALVLGFGLTPDEALPILAGWNTICEPPWTEAELRHKLASANADGGPRGHLLENRYTGPEIVFQRSQPSRYQKDIDLLPSHLVTNGVQVETGERNGKTGKPKTAIVPLTMTEFLDRHRTLTGDWPRRVGASLFVHDQAHGVGWLEKPASLFGWLARTVGKIKWHAGPAMLKQGEVFAELQRTAQRCESVESLPHEPPIEGHYYACQDIEPGDGSALRWLLSRFNPATAIDGDLILSAFLTPLWGGPPGCRPCYVITSDDGRGAGKSTLAELVGAVFDGVLQFSHLEDIATIKTRLLSPEALTRRVALIDNIKSNKFSWGELESLITASTIGGRRLYVGEATRPNSLTWFLTLNGAALSCDMAQRSIIIKVSKPARSATWYEETSGYIQEHQRAILGDLVGVLRGPVTPLREFTRWATWERDILQRLPEPGDAQKTIVERQAAVDVDEEESSLVEDYFADQLRRLGYDVDAERVFIPSQVSARWYGWAVNQPTAVIAASRQLNQMATEGRLRRISISTGRSWGRGFIWTGENWPGTHTSVDLQERIRDQRKDAKDT